MFDLNNLKQFSDVNNLIFLSYRLHFIFLSIFIFLISEKYIRKKNLIVFGAFGINFVVFFGLKGKCFCNFQIV